MTTTQAPTLTVDDIFTELEALSNESVRERNARNGAGDNQFGVKLGDIRKVAKPLKTNHALALELWATGNIDARLLAILIMKPNALSAVEMDQIVREATFVQVADWLNAYVVKKHPDKEMLRQQWMVDSNPMAARAGWNLTADRVAASPDGLDIPALLGRIASEMGDAPPEVQWTMNNTLAAIGINFPAYRQQALDIGETLGVFRDYPVSKGCTSPFAPIWINEMVSRQT